MIYFETPRLIFRDWKEQDLREFRMMNKDSRVMRYFPETLTEQETDSLYEMIRDELSLGYGAYAVETKDNHEFIGFIGFHRATFAAAFTPCVEIAWRLNYAAWGKGYATEGAKACLDYGFNTLGLDEVYSFTAKANLPSENVMKKLGMKKVMEFKHPHVAENSPLAEHVLYMCQLKSREEDG
ncbi:GNAT family N-acetyltransferase [Desulfitobacterium hafniense]|nr:GNAT family N-acetyltransferase [Desulfitobacterium hafniense]